MNISSTNLHPWGSNDVKSTDHAGDKVDHFGEAVLADTPRTIDEEHHICFGSFANWGRQNTVGMKISKNNHQPHLGVHHQRQWHQHTE